MINWKSYQMICHVRSCFLWLYVLLRLSWCVWSCPAGNLWLTPRYCPHLKKIKYFRISGGNMWDRQADSGILIISTYFSSFISRHDFRIVCGGGLDWTCRSFALKEAKEVEVLQASEQDASWINLYGGVLHMSNLAGPELVEKDEISHLAWDIALFLKASTYILVMHHFSIVMQQFLHILPYESFLLCQL